MYMKPTTPPMARPIEVIRPTMPPCDGPCGAGARGAAAGALAPTTVDAALPSPDRIVAAVRSLL